ncbi:MAG: hypothetical protein ACC655_03090 [Rhodothermia bacterium]
MDTVIFVYNAESGLINGLKDAMHKLISPSTYPCNLCTITYGSMGMHDEWREFVAGLGVPVEFLHKNELSAQYGIDDVSLPAAFVRSDEGTLSSFLDSETLDSLTSLGELKTALSDRIAEIAGS